MAGRPPVVKAVLRLRKARPDPAFETGMARHLPAEFGRDCLLELYHRRVTGEDKYTQMMRRILLKALVRHCGDGLTIGSQVGFKHPETFEIGGSVFIGAGAYHTRNPAHVPIVKTDLEIRPMRVRAWIDIGTNAVLLPAVSIGKGAIVGAGTGVTKDVPPFAIVARVPARLLWWREGRTNSRAQPLPPRRASTNR